MLLVGLIIGVLVGGAAGYLIWHGTSGNPRAGTTPSPTPSPTPSTTPTLTPTPATSTPVTSGQNIVPCPVTTPSGQHVLGNPAGPGQNQHTDPTLDFCGHGTTTLPAGTTRFMTGDNWGVGIADSCPSGSAGAGGMGTVLTLTEVLPGGGQGPDTVAQQGDWTDDGGMNMTTGGNYQLHVVAVSPSCVWHIAIYPS